MRYVMVITVLLALGIPGVARAEPPTNDNRAAAEQVPAFPATLQGTTVGATVERLDPQTGQCGASESTVWYRIDQAPDGLIRLAVQGDGLRSGRTCVPRRALGDQRGALRQRPCGCCRDRVVRERPRRVVPRHGRQAAGHGRRCVPARRVAVPAAGKRSPWRRATRQAVPDHRLGLDGGGDLGRRRPQLLRARRTDGLVRVRRAERRPDRRQAARGQRRRHIAGRAPAGAVEVSGRRLRPDRAQRPGHDDARSRARRSLPDRGRPAARLAAGAVLVPGDRRTGARDGGDAGARDARGSRQRARARRRQRSVRRSFPARRHVSDRVPVGRAVPVALALPPQRRARAGLREHRLRRLPHVHARSRRRAAATSSLSRRRPTRRGSPIGCRWPPRARTTSASAASSRTTRRGAGRSTRRASTSSTSTTSTSSG